MPVLLWTFPLALLLQCPTGFGLLCFHFHSSSLLGFRGHSAGKESSCNAGDPGLSPRSWRSAGEEIGYPFQYSWASLVAQVIKNLPAMQETWVWTLGWENPLAKGKATLSSILAWVHGVAKSRTRLSDFHIRFKTWPSVFRSLQYRKEKKPINKCL